MPDHAVTNPRGFPPNSVPDASPQSWFDNVRAADRRASWSAGSPARFSALPMPMATSAWLKLARRFPDGCRNHGHSGDVVAGIDGKSPGACLADLRLPFIECRWLIPAQRLESGFQLRFGVVAECRDASARGADQRGKAAADLRTELKVLPGLGDRDDDDVIEADDVHPEHRHIEGLTDAIQHRLRQIGEPVAPQPVPRERENARLQRIALGVGIEGDKFLGHQGSEYVEAGARYQAELACDGMHAERRIAFPEQAQNRCRTRNGGRFARFHGPRELAVRSRAALPLLGHWMYRSWMASQDSCCIYEMQILYLQ